MNNYRRFRKVLANEEIWNVRRSNGFKILTHSLNRFET